MYRCLKPILLLTTFLLLLSLPVYADNFPEKPINFIVSFGVGGSTDRMARLTSNFFADEIGTPVKVMNKPGAGTLIGTKDMLRAPADGYNILVTNAVPSTVITVLGEADYTLDDFAFLPAQWYDPDVIVTTKGTPYNNLAELLLAIKENPGKVRASVTQGSSGHLYLLLLLNSLDIPLKNLNLVIYQSGGEARAAVAGGQVDIFSGSSGSTISVSELVRPLAVGGRNRVAEWDAPTINEAIKSLNVTVPTLSGTVRGYLVHKDVKTKYPERYAKLVQAFKQTLENEDAVKLLKNNQVGYTYVAPEEFEEDVRTYQEAMKKYKALLEQ